MIIYKFQFSDKTSLHYGLKKLRYPANIWEYPRGVHRGGEEEEKEKDEEKEKRKGRKRGEKDDAKG